MHICAVYHILDISKIAPRSVRLPRVVDTPDVQVWACIHLCTVPWEGRLRQLGAVYIAFFYDIGGCSCPKSLRARERRLTAVIGAHWRYGTAVRGKILS